MRSMNGGRLSDQAKRRLETMGDDDPLPDLSDLGAVDVWREAQHRAWGEGLADGEPLPERREIGGVPCLVAGSGPTIVYAHGGGFCLGTPGTALPITSRLAVRTRVVSVEYRLAPGEPFPAAVEDVVAVVEAEAERSDGAVTLCGDSAGGNLAVVAARRVPDLAASLVLFSPVLDLRTPIGATGPLLDAYVGSADRSDPEISVLAAASLTDLPPTLLQSTTTEAMHRQAIEFAERAPATTLQVWEGLWHGWHYHRELPEAWDAVDRAAAWVASLT